MPPVALELVREVLNEDIVYEYFPIGQHIVSAPGICGGVIALFQRLYPSHAHCNRDQRPPWGQQASG